MSKALHRAVARLWAWSQQGRRERLAAQTRTRFWAELREGEREAEAREAKTPTVVEPGAPPITERIEERSIRS